MSEPTQNLDLSKLPDGCDFLVGSTNGGLTIHARVGDVEEFGDTAQEALDAAIKKYDAESRLLVAQAEMGMHE